MGNIRGTENIMGTILRYIFHYILASFIVIPVNDRNHDIILWSFA
jgi:hypothetical protein